MTGNEMLRISQDFGRQNDGETTHLRLDGQVTGPWVAELRRVCVEALGNNGHAKSHLALDLAGVSFLDADGIALFRELAARRVRFTNCSTFIAEQLKGVADADR
jgi:ABC-type transporter Mla MlaB component